MKRVLQSTREVSRGATTKWVRWHLMTPICIWIWWYLFSHLLCLADLSSGWVHLPAVTAVATQWSKNFSKLLKSHRLVSSLTWKRGNVASGSVALAGTSGHLMTPIFIWIWWYLFSHVLRLADLSSGWVHLPAVTAVAIQWSKKPLKIVLGT